MSWMVSAGFIAWLGFTLGYFYRKWLELRWLPAFQAEQGAEGNAEPTAPDAHRQPQP